MKIVIKAILGLLGLILVAVLGIGLALDTLIKTGLETIGPQLLGAPVTVKAVDLSLFSGQGEIKGVVIGNPPGFETDHAIKIDHVRFAMDAPSTLSKTIVIQEIVIDGPEIVFEGTLSGRHSNIEVLRRNVKKHLEENSRSSPSQSPETETTPAHVQVENLVISNAKVKLSVTGLEGQGISVPLGDLHLRNLGKDPGSRPIAQVITQVLDAVNDRILQALASKDRLIEEGLSTVGKTLKGLPDDVESAASEALEGLKGVLGK